MPLSPVSTYVHASFDKFTCSRFCFVLLCIWCLQINWIGLKILFISIRIQWTLKSGVRTWIPYITFWMKEDRTFPTTANTLKNKKHVTAPKYFSRNKNNDTEMKDAFSTVRISVTGWIHNTPCNGRCNSCWNVLSNLVNRQANRQKWKHYLIKHLFQTARSISIK